jgi:hypothetical protein
MAKVPTLAEFQAYVGTDETEFPQQCLDTSEALLLNYVGDPDLVPDDVCWQACAIVASELFHRRSAPNGIAQFASMDGQPVRMGKDPLTAVYPLLLPFIGWGV